MNNWKSNDRDDDGSGDSIGDLIIGRRKLMKKDEIHFVTHHGFNQQTLYRFEQGFAIPILEQWLRIADEMKFRTPYDS